jgi:hypothetical protein
VRRIIAEHPNIRAVDNPIEVGDLDALEFKLGEMLEVPVGSSGHSLAENVSEATQRKPRGPQPQMARHRTIAEVVAPYRQDWKREPNLNRVADQLDKAGVEVRKTWTQIRPRAVRSWTRAVDSIPHLVVKAIEYSLRMAQRPPNNVPEL